MNLVGRDHEQALLRELIARERARLLTLTGTGGIGKTRLAHWAACELAQSFGGGTHFVDLSSIVAAEQFPSTLASALQIVDASARPPLEAVAAALRSREVLLVLDNFEHILPAAAFVQELLERCPRLQILVTSRALLHLAEEQSMVVPELAQPAAVELFVQRAHAARADFALTDANSIAVAAICERLEGIPLALELAGARIKALSAEQLAQRLKDRFGLLTRGAPEAAPRHQTLRAALDWSYQQLGPDEQAVLRSLALFRGGAVLDAVERVCGLATSLDHLERLADQSLLSVREEGGEARYRLLETVREYALERLQEAAEEDTRAERHAEWFLELAEEAAPRLVGLEQTAWLERLAREHDNLQAALSWLAASADGAAALLRLAGALWKFWEVRGHGKLGRRWLEAALARDDGTAPVNARARALHGAAILAWLHGSYDRATALHEANFRLRESIGDKPGLGSSLLHLANVMRSRGDNDVAIQRCQEALALFRELDDTRWRAVTLNSLGMALLGRGSLREARAALEESLTLFRQVGGAQRIGSALSNLGDLARAEGDYERARALLGESLELFGEVRDPWGSGACLESLALVAVAQRQAQRAALLFGAAEGLRERAGVPLPPADQPERDRALASLRLSLGREALANGRAEGQALSLEGALTLALSEVTEEQQPIALAVNDTPLTEREREVASLIARGLTNRQIAQALVITKQTADKHVGNILGKLGAASRAQVAVWFVQRGPRVAATAS